ncbi:hypothetical protein [Phenylobacterium sp. 58.2.17]|uniref:hypothetical protein n=1 Tax=Phenylobacterium sp. 58.2.17 TaxID=2969306 RepID=UPI002264E235|nr:hypothetical protein [Phenylobacterium sp. 58.2.17]MCX7586561.1 hypothetical protein [Phenylobacterium sp. 58.2.17]
MIPLPGILGEIAAIAGDRAATRLAMRHGGQEMKLSAHPESALAQVVGAEAAAAIVAAFGPVKVTIPMAHLRGTRGRRAAIAKLLSDPTVSAAKAARICDVHERTARRVREQMGSHNAAPLLDWGSEEPE